MGQGVASTGWLVTIVTTVCRDSNKTSLLTALASHQVEVRDGGLARDDLATLTSSLQAALETSDLVVSLVTLNAVPNFA